MGGQVLASPATIAGAKVELLTGQAVEVMIKGEAVPMPLSEVLGVGLPYDLVLPSPVTEWQSLVSPRSVQLAVLTDKRLADQRIEAQVIAVRGRDIQVLGAESLQVPSDVCIYGLTGDDALYAKLLSIKEGGLYLSVTSWDSRAEAALSALQ